MVEAFIVSKARLFAGVMSLEAYCQPSMVLV